MLEARHFTVFTYHKPITYGYQQKRDKCSPRQFNHLDFVTQFTTDIRHIFGQDNVVAEALSRVEFVTAPTSYDALAASQDGDDELRTPLASTTAQRLDKLPIPAPGSPSTEIRLLRALDRTFQVPHGCNCSSPSTICRTRAPKQR
jgi:hypothetical protein